jgi:hypothetical protein
MVHLMQIECIVSEKGTAGYIFETNDTVMASCDLGKHFLNAAPRLGVAELDPERELLLHGLEFLQADDIRL